MRKLDLTPIPQVKPNGEPIAGPDGKPGEDLEAAKWLCDNLLAQDQKGMTLKDMRDRFKLMGKLEAHEGDASCILDHNEWLLLKRVFDAAQVRAVIPALIVLYERVEKAPNVDRAKAVAESEAEADDDPAAKTQAEG